MFTFNGSAVKSVNITPSAIGAATSSHSHDDKYYTETEVDTKLAEKADSSHGNHVPAAQTASNKVFLRNDNTWATVTPANIGAADSSHTHTVANISDLTATATELNYMDGVISNVQTQLDNKSESDHTHKYAGSSSVGGAATSAINATNATNDGSGNNIVETYETKANASSKLTEAKTYADTAATNVKNDLLNGAGEAYDTLKELGELIDENTDAIDALEAVATNKMDKDNPTGTGSFSLNRLANSTIGYQSFAVGGNTEASGQYSHAEGCQTVASANSSHAEGYKTVASEEHSHAEGYLAEATGKYSHAEGYWNEANGEASHAEGKTTKAIGNYSHAEGNITEANGECSHAEGYNTKSSGTYSHAEGKFSRASGECSHAEGYYTEARAYCHAEGYDTIAGSQYQHVQGKFNIADYRDTYAHIVGNGVMNEETNTSSRSNAHTLDWSGNAWYSGDVRVGGTSYADASVLATTVYVDEKLVVATENDILAMLAELDLSNVPTDYRVHETVYMSDSTTGTTYGLAVNDGRLELTGQTA